MKLFFELLTYSLGLITAYCLVLMANLVDPGGEDHCWFQLLSAFANAAYLAALAVSRYSSLAEDRFAKGLNAIRLVAVVSVSLVMSLAFIGRLPMLSDDFYRYFFEGYSFSQGVNPYLVSPVHSSIVHWAKGLVNHPSLPAIYPPLVPIIFSLFSDSVEAIVFLQAIVALMIAISMVGMWCFSSLPLSRVIIWGWCPLVLVETVWNVHVDFWGAIGLLAAVGLFSRRMFLGGALQVGVAIGIKFLPILFVPRLLSTIRERDKVVVVLVGITAVLILLYLPFVYTGAYHSEAAIAYARNWSFNGLVYEVLRATGVTNGVARLLLLGCCVIGVFWLSLQKMNLACFVTLAVSLLLLFSPVVYPWYFLWLAPFAPWSGVPVLPIVSLVMPWSYYVLFHFSRDKIWSLPVELMAVEWGTITLLLLVTVSRSKAWLRPSRPLLYSRLG